MGTVSDGIHSGYSGMVGNVIGYQWRGKWCIRVRPARYRDAKSAPQLEQRSRFRQTVAFAGKAKRILQIGLHKASAERGMTECNYFMRLNNRYITLQDGKLAIDYEQLLFSEGPVAPVAFNSVEMVGETTLRIGFEKNPLHRVTSPSDQVYVVLYFPELDQFYLPAPALRREKQIDIELEERWIGQEMHLWGFVQDYAGRTSETQYIGNGEPMEEEEETFSESSLRETEYQNNMNARSNQNTQNTRRTPSTLTTGAGDSCSDKPPE